MKIQINKKRKEVASDWRKRRKRAGRCHGGDDEPTPTELSFVFFEARNEKEKSNTTIITITVSHLSLSLSKNMALAHKFLLLFSGFSVSVGFGGFGLV